MSNEVDARPISESCGKPEQQKAHRHVLKRSHLKEPTEPIKRSRSTTVDAVTTKHRQHQVLGDEVRRNCQETEIVAGVNAMPECTHGHCRCHSIYNTRNTVSSSIGSSTSKTHLSVVAGHASSSIGSSTSKTHLSESLQVMRHHQSALARPKLTCQSRCRSCSPTRHTLILKHLHWLPIEHRIKIEACHADPQHSVPLSLLTFTPF